MIIQSDKAICRRSLKVPGEINQPEDSMLQDGVGLWVLKSVKSATLSIHTNQIKCAVLHCGDKYLRVDNS